MRLALVKHIADFERDLAFEPFILQPLAAFHGNFLERGLAGHLVNHAHAIGNGFLQHPHVEEEAGPDQGPDVLLHHVMRPRLPNTRLNVGTHNRPVDGLRSNKPNLDIANGRTFFFHGPDRQADRTTDQQYQPLFHSASLSPGRSSSLTRAASSKRVNSLRKLRLIVPVGPLRCFAMTNWAWPLSFSRFSASSS